MTFSHSSMRFCADVGARSKKRSDKTATRRPVSSNITSSAAQLLHSRRMPRGTYALASLVTPVPSFVRSDRLKRQGRVGARDWEELCAYYDGKCAHCGVKVKNPDKGHMNPDKGLELSNLIPLCARVGSSNK